jgi:hypothetical protein
VGSQEQDRFAQLTRFSHSVRSHDANSRLGLEPFDDVVVPAALYEMVPQQSDEVHLGVLRQKSGEVIGPQGDTACRRVGEQMGDV